METTDQNEAPKTKWYASLQFRLFIIFFTFLLVLSVSVVHVVQKRTKERVFSSSRAYTIEKGHSVANRIGQQVAYIEGVANSMARIASTAPTDPDLLHELIPSLLENDLADSMIAGGGVWPEPYQFNPDRERNSFFWGREPDGQLIFYDDYNTNVGNGYHNEEWYVPAKYCASGETYWSQSYTDPYSREPMVTCTVPYFRNGVHSGVVTVDVKLEGLHAMFEEEAIELSGYIFAVDRNNRFISYPNKAAVRKENPSDPTSSLTYITADEMLETEAKFQQFSDKFNALNESNHTKSVPPLEVEALAQLLAAESYQIELDYARLIARESLDSKKINEIVHQHDFINPNDPILNKASFNIIFDIPTTHWKLSVVAPLDLLILPTEEFVDVLVRPLLVIAVVCLLGAMLMTHQILIAPIKQVTGKIITQNKQGSEASAVINYDFQDELGQLVYHYNSRSKSLLKARAQAEAALVAKRNFIANISHEIRTPMNGILLSAEILEKKDLPEESLQYARTIKQSSNALLSIINEILDYTKLKSNKLALDTIDFSLEALMIEASDLFKASAMRKEISFQVVQSSESIDRFHGDYTHLRQIIFNLVGNAIKFTESGNVKLEANYSEADQRLIIKVHDTGIGIRESEQARIFDDFTQADTSITRNYGGTGLGLSICRALAELMSGKITVESIPGEGSCFTLTIPITAALTKEPSPKETPNSSEAEMKFSGALLLVEDNLVNQKLEEHLFTKLGFDVTTVNNGREAVEACKKQNYDIVMMDLQMPVLDGLSATREIRKLEHSNRDVIIIALSASVGAAIKEECSQFGMQGFLEKPVRLEKLKREIHRVLNSADARLAATT
ncbi:MAG: ATP-binding protein [Opitutaceae bacterium]